MEGELLKITEQLKSLYNTQLLVKTPINNNKMPTVEEIEQQTMSLINGSSSPGTSGVNEIQNEFDQLNVSKKKKTRRRPRHRKRNKKKDDSQEDVSDEVGEEIEWSFNIRPVADQTSAKVYRIKNGINCKHINVKFFNSYFDNHGIIYTSSFYKTNPEHKAKPTRGYESPCKDAGKSQSGGVKSKSNNLNMVINVNSNSKNQNESANSSPRRQRKKKIKKFENYWPMQEVSEGLESGALVKGVLRINAKNFREGYISNPDRSEQDYLIAKVSDRNRALEGDVVVIKIKPENEWTEKQKTAFVVHILEKIHSRTAIGCLHLMPDRNKQYAAFVPRDVRVPKMKIPMNTCPPGFHAHPHRYENMLFKAKIAYWKDVKHPVGTLIENIGVLGDLESETAAILSEHELDPTPVPSHLLSFAEMSEQIPPKEFDYREDLRKICIFTIDPLTARDLDDAVSCVELDNGNLEIGVHISDVSFSLKEDTPLDKVVAKKATTIYLVNSVYHMLPRELCLHCSLLPGVDKLAFSVFWEMSRTGEIINRRFSRSVINSCTQLAYEHAQMMIEDPNRVFQDGELPEVHGGFTYKDLSKIVNCLQPIAVNLREQRFKNGALRIDQTKLLFRLDEDSGEPTEFFVYENKDAHRLIEEFMLLANITVAKRIVADFPDIAFLRRHDPPNIRLLNDLERNLRYINIEFDASSSKDIHSSMLRVKDEYNLGPAPLAVLNHLLAKPMARAEYFCSGRVNSDSCYHHYALHVPIYTHFTSPIRRYADVMVHRLLSASLGYTEKPNWSPLYVYSIATNCNKQKYQAKCAGDASSDLYLAHYVADHQPYVEQAVVVDVKSFSFDVLVVNTGSIIRIYLNSLGENVKWSQETIGIRKIVTLTFPELQDSPESIIKLQLFSLLKVSLTRKPKTNKLEARLLRPMSDS